MTLTLTLHQTTITLEPHPRDRALDLLRTQADDEPGFICFGTLLQVEALQQHVRELIAPELDLTIAQSRARPSSDPVASVADPSVTS